MMRGFGQRDQRARTTTPAGRQAARTVPSVPGVPAETAAGESLAALGLLLPSRAVVQLPRDRCVGH